MRIWIDTDLGSDVDDALALAYGLKHPELEVVGVSTVFGDVELRSRCVASLLKIAGQTEIPVLTGLGKPFTERRTGVMFGHEGLGLLPDPSPRLRIQSEDPRETKTRTSELARALTSAAPDFVVAIGPLTNLAAVLRTGTPLPPLAIMGGKATEVMLPGMTKEIGEWNFFSDPVAAREVLSASGNPAARIVPAEVTFRTSLAPADLASLTEGDALCTMLHTLCTHWLNTLRTNFGSESPRVALHDPLTIATLMEPNLCSYATHRLEIDDRGNARSVAGQPNAELALDVDLAALRNHLLEIWLSTANE